MSRILFVSDMDGTLLNSEARLSAETSALISELTDEGAYFTVATARTPATVQGLLEDTRMRLPAIVMTGAALWHTDTQQYSHVHYIPHEEYAAIDRAFSDARISAFIYCLAPDHHLHVYHRREQMLPAEAQFVAERRHLALKEFHIGELPPSNDDKYRVLQFAMGTEEGVRSVCERLRSVTHCQVSFYQDTYTDAWILEVFAPGVSKAAAIKGMKERLGAERLVVYGDNLNDISMFEIADTAIAVDNALPLAKEAADAVIGPNTSDAVARSIAAIYRSSLTTDSLEKM